MMNNMTLNAIPVLTIDGPSGVGKGTAALRVAQHLGWHILDSGALYRVLGQAAIKHGVAFDAADALEALAQGLEIEFLPDSHTGDTRIVLEGTDVTQAARSEEGGKAASLVAAIPQVRAALLERQQAFCQAPGLVADGRDMGTVVFPHAVLKIFLTASPEERANRRYKQLKEKGIDVNLPGLVKQLVERDTRDSQRLVAPLVAADDAIQIDTSHLDIESMVQKILTALHTALQHKGVVSSNQGSQ